MVSLHGVPPPQGRPRLSVALITKNEAHNIRECLASVSWADELVVVDSGSTDGTPEIAASLGAKVIVTPDWPGFGPQKNRALQATTGDWILAIDADERVSPPLQAEIEAILAHDPPFAFEMPRLTYFLGRPVRHCGWYPDHGVRLFRQGDGQYSDHLVHEALEVRLPRQKLQNPLLHFSYRSQADVEAKIQAYGSAGAKDLVRRGKRPSMITPLLKAGWAWIRTYLIRAGFLDGSTGFAIAIMNARTTYLKYHLASKHANCT